MLLTAKIAEIAEKCICMDAARCKLKAHAFAQACALKTR